MKEKLKMIMSAVRQKEFPIFLFLVFLFIFTYPFSLKIENGILDFHFTYHFTAWFVLIMFLVISNYTFDSE